MSQESNQLLHPFQNFCVDKFTNPASHYFIQFTPQSPFYPVKFKPISTLTLSKARFELADNKKSQ
jgi:hypothetical protein